VQTGKWISEIQEDAGSAFSLRVNERVHTEQSPFQRIEVYKTTDFGYLLVINDYLVLTSRDGFLTHEMLAHPALFTHRRPRRVCIIGGGSCGTLREVLRHREVGKVWQIEIDPAVTRVAERFFPELCELNGDPRVRYLHQDGVLWLRDLAPDSLDLIILDTADPAGSADALAPHALHGHCLQALAPGGLLVQPGGSPLYHGYVLRRIHASLASAGFADSQTLFYPQPTYASGWWTAILARKSRPIKGFREEDAAQRPFATRYYSPEIHRAALAVPEFVKTEMQLVDTRAG